MPRAAKRTGGSQSLRAPTEAQVRGFLADLMGTLEADPVAGRQVLHEIMSPLTLTPKTAPRGYECRAELRLPSDLGSAAGAEVIRKCSSGGASSGFPTPRELVETLEFFLPSLRAA